MRRDAFLESQGNVTPIVLRKASGLADPATSANWDDFRKVIPLVPLRSFRAADSAPPKVAILLCTMQAQQFLAEQLNSFATQTHPTWEIWASDDGSDDHTHAILEYYQSHWGSERLSIHSGPAEGSTANFLSLTCRADIDTDYFAYADQDDIWETDKLERAVAWLETVPRHIPAMYGSRTQLVDARNQHLGYSALFRRPPSFANALVQNVAGGNTMVFNRAARDLLRQAGENVQAITHDWWAYMLITGSGGLAHYDPYPTVRYRQHGNNQFGTNQTLSASLQRARLLLKGRYRNWIDANLAALRAASHLLTPDHRRLLDRFADARRKGPLERTLVLQQLGIYRQTWLGNLGITIAALINRL